MGIDEPEPITENVPKPRRAGDRKDQRLQDCRDAIHAWRRSTRLRSYAKCIFGVQAIMSNAVLEKIAKHARIKTMEDLNLETPDWDFKDKYGEEVLALLMPIDAKWMQEHTAAIKERAQLRKRDSEAKAIERKETRRATLQHKNTIKKEAKDAEKAARALRPIASSSSNIPAAPAGGLPFDNASASAPTFEAVQFMPPETLIIAPAQVYPSFTWNYVQPKRDIM